MTSTGILHCLYEQLQHSDKVREIHPKDTEMPLGIMTPDEYQLYVKNLCTRGRLLFS